MKKMVTLCDDCTKKRMANNKCEMCEKDLCDDHAKRIMILNSDMGFTIKRQSVLLKDCLRDDFTKESELITICDECCKSYFKVIYANIKKLVKDESKRAVKN